MQTVQRPATTSAVEQRVILRNVSWDTYERLLADHLDRGVPHFNFDQGVLEIVSPLPEHERRNEVVKLLVNVVAEELDLNIVGTGSTTFKRRDLERGFEPDSSFYIRHEAHIRDKRGIDLANDPPPDLVVEIDLTRSSLDKLPLYAQLGVPEVWRDDGGRVAILVLRSAGDGYDPAEASAAFPVMTRDALERWWTEGIIHPRREWPRSLRVWVRGSVADVDDAP